MFIIKDTVTGLIHREPTRAAYWSKTYKSARAAKAGITRTLKYYQKAIEINQWVFLVVLAGAARR